MSDDHLSSTRFTDLFPPLGDVEYDSLKELIREHGQQIPIELDEQGTILDGAHRARACRELGLEPLTVVRRGLDELGKRHHVLGLNLARRHLSQDQRRVLITQELRADPEQSNGKVARLTGASHHTVAAVRRHLQESGAISETTVRRGIDGRLTAPDLTIGATGPRGEHEEGLPEQVQGDIPVAPGRDWLRGRAIRLAAERARPRGQPALIGRAYRVGCLWLERG